MPGTWIRPTGTKYGVTNVRCWDCDPKQERQAHDADGDRCYTPWTVGTKCEKCGKDC